MYEKKKNKKEGMREKENKKEGKEKGRERKERIISQITENDQRMWEERREEIISIDKKYKKTTKEGEKTRQPLVNKIKWNDLLGKCKDIHNKGGWIGKRKKWRGGLSKKKMKEGERGDEIGRERKRKRRERERNKEIKIN